MTMKRVLCFLLTLCTLLSVLCGITFTVSAAEAEFVEVSADSELTVTSANYGLAKNIQDGNILHCFDWKYNDIKAELKNIAEAGFTSVQTSPAQPKGGGDNKWYWLYQPLGFYVASNPLGSKSDLQALCQEAEKYGIKVIVDVVANHLAGDHSNIQNDLKDWQYWHTHGSVSNWADRYQVVNGEIGMPDINSEHPYVQQAVAKYMKELEGMGVDGIRWDAAKHIALPSENCQFWPAVTKNNSMWHYGEILVGPDDRGSGNEGLMKEYTNYMSVTDSSYGAQLRESFNSGNAPGSHGNWVNKGVADNKLVYWGESHDTWSNGKDWGFSNEMSQNTIDRAFAVAASRNGACGLYFSRPGSKDKDNIHAGQKGSTAFMNKEVAAVNQLKNACVGEKDYYVSENGAAAVCRQSGAVVVLGSGGNRNVSISNGGGTTKPGTYKDLVSGSTFTVTNSQISGQVGQSGIAVLLNATPRVEGPSASVSPDSKNYTTDTLELTLSFDNATSGQYSINGGAYQSFTNGQKITIGKGTVAGTKTTISVKASNGSTTSDVETYTYNYAELADTGIYCDSTGKDWSKVNCYVYKNGQGFKEWPGEAMTKVADNLWYYQLPANFENCQVIFSDGGNNQYPTGEGLQYSGGAMIYADGNWEPHVVVKPNVTPTPTTASTTVQTEATVPTVPTQAPVKTDPKEDDNIIVIPPVPGTSATTPVPTTTRPIENSSDKYMYGDVDLNEKISIKDATVMQKALAKMTSLDTLQLIISDVNADGKVNVKDVTAVQKFCANILKIFGSGKWYTVFGESTEPTEAVTQKPVLTDPTEPATKAPTKPTPPPTAPTQSVTEAPAIPTEEPTLPTQAATNPTPDGMITVYFKNDYKWSNVKAHFWNSDGSKTTVWPGESMTLVSGDYYSITISDDNVYIIFSDNGNNQTGDLSVPGANKYFSTDTNQWHDYTGSNNSGNTNNNNISNGNYIYFKDTENWNCAYAHTWGNGETTWPGTRMDHVEGNIFRLEVPSGHRQVVFNDGNGNRKTGDINIEIGKMYNYSSGQWENI